MIAVDIPIGLPERARHGGRAAENAVRPLLGARQSSVFSVPSRAALAAADYRDACRIALATSQPPRMVSKQLFMIAPKIREVDACLREDGASVARVFEVHPEVAFWRLNGGRALAEPKKVKGRCYEPGLALRRRLLVDAGLAASRWSRPRHRGAPDRRSDRRARLRRGGAAHSRRPGDAVSRSARTRRVRAADGDLGVSLAARLLPLRRPAGIGQRKPLVTRARMTGLRIVPGLDLLWLLEGSLSEFQKTEGPLLLGLCCLRQARAGCELEPACTIPSPRSNAKWTVIQRKRGVSRGSGRKPAYALVVRKHGYTSTVDGRRVTRRGDCSSAPARAVVPTKRIDADRARFARPQKISRNSPSKSRSGSSLVDGPRLPQNREVMRIVGSSPRSTGRGRRGCGEGEILLKNNQQRARSASRRGDPTTQTLHHPDRAVSPRR